MKTLKKIVFTGLLALIACAGVAQAQELYKDEKAPMHERIMDLLSRLTVEEKISLLRATSPGISRLDIPKYYHGNEALHGVVRTLYRFPASYRTGGNLESGAAIAGSYGYF